MRQPELVLRRGGHRPPVYGSLTWSKAVEVETKLPALLHRLWGGLKLSEASPGSPMPFADVAPLFNNPQAAKAKPIMENTKWLALLSWLILCNLSSHFPGHVAPPTSRDLAGLIISAARKHGGGQGPLKATGALQRKWWEKHTKPSREDADELKHKLVAVRSAIVAKLPPAVIWEFCARGELSWVDIEYTLCKVTRDRDWCARLC